MAKKEVNPNCAEYWIEKLKLWPHPGLETGFLDEVYRDSHQVTNTTGKDRNAATNIYFLHKPGTHLLFPNQTICYQASTLAECFQKVEMQFCKTLQVWGKYV